MRRPAGLASFAVMPFGQNNSAAAPAGHFSRMGLAYLVLALGLVTTLAIRQQLLDSADRDDRERFETEVSRTYASMGYRVNHYLVAVQHLQGLFHAGGEVTAEEWSRWIPSMNWRWQYPNLLEIGYAEKREAGEPPVVVLSSALGQAARSFPVGHRFATTNSDLAAMEASARTAQTTSSGVRRYLGPSGPEDAHVIFYPVYRSGFEPRGAAQRVADLRGHVFGLFRAGDLYTETVGAETNLTIRLVVQDMTEASAETLSRLTNSAGLTIKSASGYSRTEIAPVLGRLWSLHYETLPSFRAGSRHGIAGVVSVTGAALSLTVFAIAWVQATGRSRALRLGSEIQKLNADLERRIADRTAQLEAANRDLRQEIEDRKRGEQIQRATYQISEAVHSTEDLKNLYERIHAIIGSLMPAENFFLLLHDPHSDKHVYVHHVDEMDEWPVPRRITGGLVGYILRTGLPLLVDKASMSDSANEWHFVSGTPSEIWLGVPLLVRGKTIGVMAVQDYRNPKAYGEAEKQILTFVAEQIALAIEQKRAEASIAAGESMLRASEERFRTAFRFSPALMTLTRFRDGQFVTVNDAFLKTFGYREDEVIGKGAQELGLYLNPEQRTEFRELLRTHGVVRDREHPMRTKDGSVITLLLSGEMMTIGGEDHTLTVGLDITGRKKAEQDILRALEAEKELGELKSRFVSMVSHEFRTPLGIVMSAVELLQHYIDRLSAEKRAQLLGDIRNATRRMGELMEQVLLLGRVEAGRLKADLAPLALEPLCHRLLDESFSATSGRCPIKLVVDVPAECEAVGDEALMRHIFSNLLSNASKYSPEGTTVRWNVQRDGEDAVFNVVDQGIGIPVADLPRLFEAFHRGRNVGETQGTGLGLLIVKHCVELHGGSIDVASEEGVGTTFTVRLPLFRAAPPPPSSVNATA